MSVKITVRVHDTSLRTLIDAAATALTAMTDALARVNRSMSDGTKASGRLGSKFSGLAAELRKMPRPLSAQAQLQDAARALSAFASAYGSVAENLQALRDGGNDLRNALNTAVAETLTVDLPDPKPGELATDYLDRTAGVK